MLSKENLLQKNIIEQTNKLKDLSTEANKLEFIHVIE